MIVNLQHISVDKCKHHLWWEKSQVQVGNVNQAYRACADRLDWQVRGPRSILKLNLRYVLRVVMPEASFPLIIILSTYKSNRVQPRVVRLTNIKLSWVSKKSRLSEWHPEIYQTMYGELTWDHIRICAHDSYGLKDRHATKMASWRQTPGVGGHHKRMNF